MWTVELAKELEEHLEKAAWKKSIPPIMGKSDRWAFTVFDKGLDTRRSCEVMATNGGTIVRLPPELAEKGLKIALEKSA